MKKLTVRQRLFVREYLVDRNGTQAAIRTGYSPKSARFEAARLLTNDNIQAEVNRLLQEQEKRVEVKADMVLSELYKIAMSDLRKLFKEDGSLKDPKDMPNDIAMAVSGIDVDEIWAGQGKNRVKIGETKKVRFWDKPKALELLGKHLRMFAELHEHDFKRPLRIVSLNSVKSPHPRPIKFHTNGKNKGSAAVQSNGNGKVH